MALLFEVGFTVGLLGGIILGAALLEHIEQFFQDILFGVLFCCEIALFVTVGEEFLLLLGNLLMAQGKECGLDGLHLVLHLLDGTGCHLAHHVHELALALAGKVEFAALRLLSGCLLNRFFLGGGGCLLGYGFLNFNFFIHNFLSLVLGLSAQVLIFLEIVHRFRLFTRFHHIF